MENVHTMKAYLCSEKLVTTLLAIALVIACMPIIYVYRLTTSLQLEANAKTAQKTLPSPASDSTKSLEEMKAVSVDGLFPSASSDGVNQQINEHQSSHSNLTTPPGLVQSEFDSDNFPVGQETVLPTPLADINASDHGLDALQNQPTSELDSNSLLLELESALLTPSADTTANGHKMYELQNQITTVAASDIHLRDQLMQVLHNNLGTPFGKLVEQILTDVSAPELVEFGFELINMNDVVGIEPGLALVKKNAPNDPRALVIAEQIIQQQVNEPRILNLAIDIIMQSQDDEASADYNFSVFSALTQHPDSEVRSNSLFRYASLARDEYDLDLVLKALHSPNKIDRMSAAQALSVSPIKSDTIRDELMSKATDQNEFVAVRQAAAEGLYGLEMSIEQQQILAKLQDEEYEF